MKIGLIGAMNEEISAFLKVMENSKKIRWGKIDFYEGSIKNQKVVMACSGIGKVNAAACVQMMADRFAIDALIFTGIAGGLDPRLNVGDVVISEDAVQYDFDSSQFGYDVGMVPRLWKKYFYGDRALIVLFRKAAEVVFKEDPKTQAVIGRVLSGDSFVSSAGKAEFLRKNFQGHCVEMEGAAAAQICYLNNIPFVIIRSISDRADQSAQVDYKTFTSLAVYNSTVLVKEVFKGLDS